MQAASSVALVTGGSRGIGRAIVEALLARDWTVFLGSRDAESVQHALDDLTPVYGGRVAGRVCDVSDQKAVDELISWVVKGSGRLDCLVNNAGIGIFSPVDQLSGEQWRQVLQTNLDGAFYAIRAATPVMKDQGSGWIFNIASLASRNPFPTGAAYNASKFGLLGLSEATMLDLRPYGIRVSAILPGSVRTDFSHPKPGASDDWKLAPEDIARVVVDLLDHPDRSLPSLLEIRPSRPPAH